jgi:predicted nucleic acid-binding protein
MIRIEPLLLDACGLINIAATGRIAEIADFFGGLLVVEDVAEEAPRAVAVASTLAVIFLGDAESETLVALAAIDGMDAGEAATFAVAAARRLPVVTDDRRAIRAATEHTPDVRIYRTASVLRAFVDQAQLSHRVVEEMLKAVESEASFAPADGTTDADWWLRSRATT